MDLASTYSVFFNADADAPEALNSDLQLCANNEVISKLLFY